MKSIDYEDIWHEINCIKPVYDSNGRNSTEICLANGEVLIDGRKTAGFLKYLAKLFAVDISAVRVKYYELIGRKNSMPLPFHTHLILAPVKTRVPLVKDDGAWGYVVLDKIGNYIKHPEIDGSVKLYFKDGSSLDILHSFKSLRAIIDDTVRIKNEFDDFYNLKIN